MRWIFLIIFFLAALASSPADARALRCDGGLVQIGDPIWQVGRVCPTPFWREDYDEPLARDRRGHVAGWQRVEIWTLNFGTSRFMRRLVFRNGYLNRIETLGYGVRWEPGTRRCTWRELEQAGNTAAEVFARCGEPDFRYDLPPPVHSGRYSPAWASYSIRERWIYDYGSGRHARELDFLDGRLQNVNRHRR